VVLPFAFSNWIENTLFLFHYDAVFQKLFKFTDNLLFMARYYINHWEFQAVGNATFSVDTFFFLSGLLVAYLGLRQLARKNGAMNVPLMYFFRYLRCVVMS